MIAKAQPINIPVLCRLGVHAYEHDPAERHEALRAVRRGAGVRREGAMIVRAAGRAQMSQTLEQNDDVALPFKAKGWRNLWLVLKDWTPPDSGKFHPGGTTRFGNTLHPTKEDAVEGARRWLEQQPEARDTQEWLGAFEVDE